MSDNAKQLYSVYDGCRRIAKDLPAERANALVMALGYNARLVPQR